ncbi:MAG: class I SAM-dependent methyltransferase [Candidatus Krumholzibacteria bacterium]|nr:class I SAM-dependent methyltransferase [Candidatus Krumholzibacteria bacterium]MDH5627396.1 class I SAM-dependent methyltransferase [Candidatus Krumholzibacteria bacterium]
MSELTSQVIVNKAITLNSSLPPGPLLAYIQDLLRWNPQLGLVSRRDPLAACERLVLESVELLTLARARGVASPARCVDVGSGGGFPGMVWALAEPQWHFLLVERKLGRAAFLRAEVLRLGLTHVEVFAGSIEEAAIQDPLRAAFGIAVAMAVGAPADIAPGVEPLLSAGGLFLGTIPAGVDLPQRLGKAIELVGSEAGDYGNYAQYQVRGAD